ncbi:MAG TPA: hypothetical protein VIU61_11690 [Kofleriaceae bacterium]
MELNRFLLATVAVVAVACGGDAPTDTESVRNYIETVSTDDGVGASFVAGDPPAEGAGPALTVTTNAAVIPGGTTPVLLTADRAFTVAIIAVAGIDGYFRLTLPSARTSVELLVTLSQLLDVTDFEWIYGAGGAYETAPARVVNVGTGDVQVSLSWDTSADVDLHVIDPAGDEVLWLERLVASGGELDLDSNAGCSGDDVRNENVTWPVGGAPSGTYRVLVDYWSNCGVAVTEYTVTVNVKGQPPATFTGSFTGEGDQGGVGAGVPITTFSSAGTSAKRTRELGTIEVSPVAGAIRYEKE